MTAPIRAYAIIALFTASLALVASPTLAAGDPPARHACEPAVASALDEAARAGVAAELVTIRHPTRGIRQPQSLFDFSCIERLFDYRAFNIHFSPERALDQLLGIVNRKICRAARQAYAEAIGRPLDAAIYTDDLPRGLPGVDLRHPGGNILDDIGKTPSGGHGSYGDILGVEK